MTSFCHKRGGLLLDVAVVEGIEGLSNMSRRGRDSGNSKQRLVLVLSLGEGPTEVSR